MTVSADRPGYLAETLRSWLQVRGRQHWSFAFLLEPGIHYAECEELIQTWRAVSGVDSCVVYNSKRQGVMRNPYNALRFGFERVPFVVLAEEDVVISDDVLEFFTALSTDQESSDALGICAFSRGGSGSPAEYEPRLDFSPLVWGTWLDRWSAIIEPLWFDAVLGPEPGVREGWDWGMRRIMQAVDRPFLAPMQSRSQHIGEHGVHMLPVDFVASQSSNFVQHRRPTRYQRRVDAV